MEDTFGFGLTNKQSFPPMGSPFLTIIWTFTV